MFKFEDEKDSGESQASEDTSEEKAEESEEDSSEDTSGEEGGEEKKESKKVTSFIDPKKVPDELKPHYKALQAKFTRKMQGLSLYERKARAFDELVANPEFRAWVEGRKEAPARKNGRVAARDDEDDDDAGEEGRKGPDIQSLVKKAVAEAVAPLLQSEYRKSAKAEWDALVEKYPQAENYRDEIREIMDEHPGMSYSKAFKAVAFDDAMGIGEEGAVKKIVKKKGADSEKPSNIKPGDKPPGRAKSIPEAFQMAVKQLKEQKKG